MFQLLKNISWHQTKYLFLFFCKHPFLMMAAFFATVKTIYLMDKFYPNQHHKHNLANAIRHALWNMLIVKFGRYFSKNTDKVVKFTKEITDWHEEFSPNIFLAKQMDLHNNQMGRTWILEHAFFASKEIVSFLQDKSTFAIKIDNRQQLLNCYQLVYLEE